MAFGTGIASNWKKFKRHQELGFTWVPYRLGWERRNIMRSWLRRFALIVVAALTGLALAQTPAHAQFRGTVPPRPVLPPPVFVPPAPRRPIVVPSPRSFINPNVIPNPYAYNPYGFRNPFVPSTLTLNQFATLSVLQQSGSLPPWMLYNPYINPMVFPYTPITYPTVSVTMPLTTPIGVPGISYNPYAFYNPYFAYLGFR